MNDLIKLNLPYFKTFYLTQINLIVLLRERSLFNFRKDMMY